MLMGGEWPCLEEGNQQLLVLCVGCSLLVHPLLHQHCVKLPRLQYLLQVVHCFPHSLFMLDLNTLKQVQH